MSPPREGLALHHLVAHLSWLSFIALNPALGLPRGWLRQYPSADSSSLSSLYMTDLLFIVLISRFNCSPSISIPCY